MSQSFTVEQLKKYDGKSSDKIYVAVAGQIFDVTVEGKTFYAPGGPYDKLAGRDASRALATWSMEAVPDYYDNLDDISDTQKQALDNWTQQFKAKYTCVGHLVKE